MAQIRLLIADKNEAFRKNLAEIMSTRFDVCTCADAKAALELIPIYRPDILVIDLLLTHGDGLDVLKHISTIKTPPAVLLTTSYSNKYIQGCITEMGVDSILMKPCPTSKAVLKIHEIAQTFEIDPTYEDPAVNALLENMGFQGHWGGTRQLRCCIPYFSTDPTMPINKVLYTVIADANGFSGGPHVERCVRRAIEKAYKGRPDPEIWEQLFPPNPNRDKPWPSNKVFISRIAELLARKALAI